MEYCIPEASLSRAWPWVCQSHCECLTKNWGGRWGKLLHEVESSLSQGDDIRMAEMTGKHPSRMFWRGCRCWLTICEFPCPSSLVSETLSSTANWGSASYENHKPNEPEGTSETIWFSPSISPRKKLTLQLRSNLPKVIQALWAEPEVLKLASSTGSEVGHWKPNFSAKKLFQDFLFPWIIAKWLLIRWGCFSNTENFRKM